MNTKQAWSSCTAWQTKHSTCGREPTDIEEACCSERICNLSHVTSVSELIGQFITVNHPAYIYRHACGTKIYILCDPVCCVDHWSASLKTYYSILKTLKQLFVQVRITLQTGAWFT